MGKEERLFPVELLDRPPKERLDYFKKRVTVVHKGLMEGIDRIKGFIKEPGGTSLLHVVGPTGVGKSTIIRRVLNLMIEAAAAELAADQGFIPVGSMEAPAPDSGNFNWKDFYVRALLALDEPLIQFKLDHEAQALPKASNGHVITRSSTVAHEMRRSLEQALRNRRVSAFFIDEAQHLTKIASGRKLQDQLECIKHLANQTETLHILVGTYELVPFLELSGQLSRRGRVVEVRRYHAEDPDDEDEFKTALNTLQVYMPLQKGPDLIKHWEYCYERSLGCIGILKDWLTLAMNMALEAGDKTVSLAHLKRHALTPRQCRHIAIEATEGERRLRESESTVTELRKLLRLPCKSVEAAGSQVQADGTGTKGSRKHRPGDRNPTRDQVGDTPSDQ